MMVIAADRQWLSPSLSDARHGRRRPVECAIDASARITIAAAVLGNELVRGRRRQPVGSWRRRRTLLGYYPRALRVREPQVAGSGILQPAAADLSERRDYRGAQDKVGPRADSSATGIATSRPFFCAAIFHSRSANVKTWCSRWQNKSYDHTWRLLALYRSR